MIISCDVFLSDDFLMTVCFCCNFAVGVICEHVVLERGFISTELDFLFVLLTLSVWEHKNMQILQFWYVRKGFKGYLTVSCHHKSHGCHPGVMFQQVVFELCTFLVNMFKTGEDKSLLPCKIKSSLKSTATVKCRNKSVYSKGHNTDEIILVQTGLQILRLL